MNILYIVHSSGLEGAGFALLNLLTKIKEYGIIPYVMLPSKGKLTEHLERMGVEYFTTKYDNYVYPPLDYTFKSYIMFIPRLLKKLKYAYVAKIECNKFVKEKKIDIIHTNTGVIHIGAVVARQNKIPHVWHIREFQDKGLGFIPLWNMSYFKKILAKKNNHCIAITESIYNYYNLTKAKDIQIYDGVFSENELQNIQCIEKENFLLYVGDLTRKKGVLDAIDAFEVVANELHDIELWLAGNDIINISNIINKSPLKNRIKVLGFRNDIDLLMSRAKALLVPNYYEGFGFIVVESMMNGCIVIGRNLAGVKEQFDNGHQYTGEEIGFRFNNQQELIEQIRRVYNLSPNERDNIIINAKKTISQYTIEKCTKEIVDFYCTLKYIN